MFCDKKKHPIQEPRSIQSLKYNVRLSSIVMLLVGRDRLLLTKKVFSGLKIVLLQRTGHSIELDFWVLISPISLFGAE